MKYALWLWSVCLVCCLLNAPVRSEAQEPAIVPEWQWVTVVNKEPIANYNGLYEKGEPCGIRAGGVLTVLGQEGQTMLVRYTFPGRLAGSQCPSGTEFLIKSDEFHTMTPRFREHQAEQAAQDALLERLRK